MSEHQYEPEHSFDPIPCENCKTIIDALSCDIVDKRDQTIVLPLKLQNTRHWNLHVCRDCYHDLTGSPGEQEPPEHEGA